MRLVGATPPWTVDAMHFFRFCSEFRCPSTDRGIAATAGADVFAKCLPFAVCITLSIDFCLLGLRAGVFWEGELQERLSSFPHWPSAPFLDFLEGLHTGTQEGQQERRASGRRPEPGGLANCS